MHKFIHRSRRIAAKVYLKGKSVLEHLSRPSEIEKVLAKLPQPAGAQSIAGRVVVITGGTQGVGLVLARHFAKAGAVVVINGRRREGLDQALATLSGEGLRVHGVLADVATDEGARALIRDAVAAAGGLDVIVNNAAVGGAYGVKAWEGGTDDFAETLRCNVVGPFAVSSAAIRWFREAGRPGRIINVSTIATERVYPGILPYTVSKVALESMNRQLAADIPEGDIVVTAITLPSVQTERKFGHDWAATELLPPADIVLPAFEHAATAPGHLLHGRVISASRYMRDAYAEGAVAGPISAMQPILYPPLMLDGAEIARDPGKLVVLDRAENQYGAAPAVKAALEQSLATRSPAFYPDDRYRALKGALSAEFNLPAESFAIGPGSWELINRIVELYAKPGEEVVSSNPGWFGFNLVCGRRGVKQTCVPFDLGGDNRPPSHNIPGYISAIGPLTRLVYIISPSNPEGVPLPHEELRALLAGIPKDMPVLFDEAYAEFGDPGEGADAAALIREGHTNLIGLRTFSKFHALAGLRIGYAYAHPDRADLIRRLEHIFSVAHVAEVAAVAALGDTAHREALHARARAERQRVFAALRQAGLAPLPSAAPYILIRKPAKFELFAEAALREGIVIAPYSFHQDNYAMYPVGAPEQNDRLLAILTRFL